MALTQAQWNQKLRGWVPSWWFERQQYAEAVFQALAKVLHEADVVADNHFQETFIAQAEDPFLSAHGDERGVSRFIGELDASYATRIRNLVSSPDATSIKNAVDALLLVGNCRIEEHDIEGLFLDVEAYCDRKAVLTEISYGTFSIVIEYQGAGSVADAVVNGIAETVNKIKALGTLYRISEGRA